MKGACAIIVLGFVAFVNAKPAGETTEVPQLPSVTDLIAQAQAGIQNLSKDIQERLGTDQETVINTIKTQSATFTTNVQEFLKKVSEDVKNKNPELEKAIEGIKTKLTDVVNDINAQIPNAQEQAADLQAKFTAGVNTIIDESNKAYKTISENSGAVREDVAKLTKQAVELAIKATQSLDEKVKALAVTPAPAA